MPKIRRYVENERGGFIEQEIFRAQTSIDGRFSDISQEDRNSYVKNIYKNTSKYIINMGISIPIKSGHTDSTQEAKGFLVGLTLKKKNIDGLGLVYSLWGRMYVYEPYLSQYREGKYPGMSVEISPEGFLPSGQTFSDHLCAVALCGIDMAAFPLLSQELSIGSHINMYKVVGPKTYSISEFKNKKDNKMEYNKDLFLEKFLEKLPDLVSSIWEELYPDKMEEEEVEEVKLAKVEDKKEKEEVKLAKVEDKKEEEEFRAEYTRLKSEKIELAYEKLAFSGKIGKDQKDNFTKIANSTGLETAISIYSAMETKRPPVSKEISSSRVGSISKDRMDSIIKLSRNNEILKNALIEKAISANN